MSRGYNRVVLLGNLARDPDIRATAQKQKTARFTVAVGRQWKDRATGEMQSHTDFIPVVAWGGTADICERYLSKGKPVLVEGRLSVRDYEDRKTGERKWMTEVVAESVLLLGSGKRDDGAPYDQRQGQQSMARQPQRNGYLDNDIGSLRDEVNFDDEFPLDFNAMSGDVAPGAGDVDLPF